MRGLYIRVTRCVDSLKTRHACTFSSVSLGNNRSGQCVHSFPFQRKTKQFPEEVRHLDKCLSRHDLFVFG